MFESWNIHAVPAHGADYRNRGDVILAWKSGKDFRDAVSGRYLNIRSPLDGREVWVRYDKLRKLVKVH
jgi:hypothetical protein